MPTARWPIRRRAAGSTTIEFALTASVFFLFAFGLLEMARILFVWNAAADGIHRAARQMAVTDFTDAGAVNSVRAAAMLSNGGTMPLGGGINGTYVLIEYLDRNRAVIPTLPPCPVYNVRNCLDDSAGACIRFVRARLCLPGTSCTPVPYQPLFAAVIPDGAITLPTFEATVPAATLGYRPGTASACP
ncbi:TadE/TadG family type IV pilus assembly protein [Zemynaea arenosa]|nr:TadE family protein [Massilia arenosa]